MKKTSKRRLFSAMLAICMVCSLFGGTKLVSAAGTPVTVGGLTITADDGSDLTYGTTAGDFDVYMVSNVVYIHTGKPVTVKGSTTTHSLAIAAGTKAEITLDGVSITTAASPINMVPNTVSDPTTLHLTLADGSTNKLDASGGSLAGIHVSYGSRLTIDDSVRTPDGVEVYGGRVTADCTVNGTAVKEGDPAWMLDSKNPGSLYVRGGLKGAGIGGNSGENSGRINIDGGNLQVIAYRPSSGGSDDSSAGAAIGGGDTAGCGCLLDGGGVVINGGVIDAKSSYHGAGIGAGWNAKTDGVGNAGRKTGDITINGGYITSVGDAHGNAFGGACNSTANVGHGSAGTPHEIVITGGTLLPKAVSSRYDVGATGGKVIVTGGSFFPAKKAGTSTGYSIEGASVVSSDGTSLIMVTIDLSSYTYTDKDGNEQYLAQGDYLCSYKVTVDGSPLQEEYGLATKLDETKKLYFWLPESSMGSPVAISDVILQTAGGEKIDTSYPFTLEEVGGAGGDVTKRYVTFEVDESEFSDELKKMLNKRYDGAPFDWDLLNQEIASQNIRVPQPVDGVIDQADMLEETAVRLLDADGNRTGEASSAVGFSQAGSYSIAVNYKAYATDADFSKTFWGHQTTITSVITRADTCVVDVAYDAQYQNGKDEGTATSTKDFGKLTITATVRPAEGEALTCEAPTGSVQFYINGVKVGAPQTLTAGTPVTREVGYNYSTATLVMDYAAGQNYLVPDNGDEFLVTAKYLGSNNYATSQADAEAKEEPAQFPVTVPPGSVVTPKDTTADDLDPNEYVDAEKELTPDKYDVVEEPGTGDRLYVYYSDEITRATEAGTMDKAALAAMINSRYAFTNNVSKPLSTGEGADAKVVMLTEDDIKITNGAGEEVESIDLSEAAAYTVTATVKDETSLSRAVLTVDYNLIEIEEPETPEDIPVNVDTDGDGYPDINVDPDGDGKPDVNVDTDGDGKPDTNVDTDDDGKPDVNVDTDDDGKPDINIVDKDGDGKPDNIDPKDPDQDKTPDVNIVDKDGDGKPDDLDDLTPEEKKELTPDVNVDTDGDGKPDTNVDTDDDGKPDVNVDTNGDGKPDINIVDKDGDGKPDNIDPKDPDQDKTPDVNIVDKDGDGEPDDLDDLTPEEKKDLTPDVNVDTDGDGKPDTNVDTDDDGKPDVNVDTDGDGKPDINIVDKDGDGKPDNIEPKDPDQDKTPDVNIVDKDGDGKPDDLDDLTPEEKKDLTPDVNVDTDGDGKPDTNVDTDDDGKPDVNVDTDGDGKPDVNIVDKDGDGKPDNIDPKDPDQDKTPDVNIVDKDGDGKPDDLDDLTPEEKKDLTPDVNVDTDGDGKPDTNVDTDDDGKPDVNVDTDGDGKPDVNIVDKDGDGKPDNIDPKDPDQDKTPDLNIVDKDGDGKPDHLDDLMPEEKKDLTPDVNIDHDKDGKPDVNVDTDGDGKPNVNIDTTGDGKPNVNIVDKDGDGKPDSIDLKNENQDKTPNVNVDTDGDGKPDVNIDTDGDGKPDSKIDADGDGLVDAEQKDPDTGDGTNLAMPISAALLAAAIAVVLIGKRRRMNQTAK